MKCNRLKSAMLIAIILLPMLSFSQDKYDENTAIDSMADDASWFVQSGAWLPGVINTTIVTEQDVQHLTIYADEKATNSAWEEEPRMKSTYDNPYRVSLFSPKNGEDSQRLWSQTKSIGAYGLGVAGTLALLPESVTHWKSNGEPLHEKWWDNVRQGPVWDRDLAAINYIGHPYFGGVYYQSARKSGYRQWDAFMYSTLMSTFYWEYGVEAFAETPSIQDLFVTPILGWVYGEWAYNKEQEIRLSGGTVWGSSALGNTTLFFLDPVDGLGNGVNHLAGAQIFTAGTGFIGVDDVALANGVSERHYKFQVQYAIGATSSSLQKKTNYYSHTNNDPVTYSIVGISAGMSYVAPSEYWQLESGMGASFSLGLHFSPAFSGHLTYTRAELTDTQSRVSTTYENYSVNALYYFNSDTPLRPFVTAGIGESMKDMDRKKKEFQVNSGLGLHYQINSNWALQGDWRYAIGTSSSTNDHVTTTKLVYRFGQGENQT
ncbi:DUF3943 domain-containing protein [Moritella sp. Urea-trap-13]|uniref:DUF3943 domain-containing protein n=1 Tax=Moritella sp. Urea-trap-13 TaxID=2058327 RepID=UPI000C343C35|nr:DUF3943 domain-containing protein [Moritella sp. Urea-trap-13]PKH06005.1 DUF3943 domain-containing protein [Moritella sp. Urea-trap-13]